MALSWLRRHRQPLLTLSRALGVAGFLGGCLWYAKQRALARQLQRRIQAVTRAAPRTRPRSSFRTGISIPTPDRIVRVGTSAIVIEEFSHADEQLAFYTFTRQRIGKIFNTQGEALHGVWLPEWRTISPGIATRACSVQPMKIQSADSEAHTLTCVYRQLRIERSACPVWLAIESSYEYRTRRGFPDTGPRAGDYTRAIEWICYEADPNAPTEPDC
jgi:hypothetical protein